MDKVIAGEITPENTTPVPQMATFIPTDIVRDFRDRILAGELLHPLGEAATEQQRAEFTRLVRVRMQGGDQFSGQKVVR